MNQENSEPKRVLRTVPQFCDENRFVTEGGLRFQIFNEEKNGLKEAGAIVRIGRKILIDVPRYFHWIDKQQKYVA